MAGEGDLLTGGDLYAVSSDTNSISAYHFGDVSMHACMQLLFVFVCLSLLMLILFAVCL